MRIRIQKSFQYVKRYIRFSYACKHCEGTESEGIAPAVISAPLMPQNTDASVIEEFRRNNSNQNIDFTTPVRIIYENGIFKPANQ